MQTMIDINDQLITQAAKLAKIDNQNQVIEIALSEYIQHHQPAKKRDVHDLVGKINIDPNYDYKKMRIGKP